MALRLNNILEAFRNLGDRATLQILYPEVERIHLRKGDELKENWRANVRERIQENSSDSTRFRGNDLFHKIKKGEWELRVHGDENEILNRAEPYMADEGLKVPKIHLKIERSAQLIKQFKKSLDGNFSCSICGFDFEEQYRALGLKYIEAHHKKPIALANGNVKTSVEDLIAVCSNCHRILHLLPLDDSNIERVVRSLSMKWKCRKNRTTKRGTHAPRR